MSSNVTDAVVPQGVEGVDPNHPAKNRTMRILDAEHGLIERTRDKLAIVGYASSTRDMAPFDDPEYDIAGLNQIYRFLPREDVHMDIHVNWDEENVEGTDHRGWIRDCGIPVLMTKVHMDLPTSVAFPVDAVIGIATDYLTSSVAFYIAWAIHQGYKRIDLFGIDLIVGTEYEFQKACAEFWLGVAHGRGIHVNIPPQSALLRHSHRYGYEREPQIGLVSFAEMDARLGGLTKQRDKQLSRLYAFDGALHENVKHDEWKDDPAKRRAWLNEQRSDTMAQIATFDGALQEAGYTRELYRLRSRGAAVPIVTE